MKKPLLFPFFFLFLIFVGCAVSNKNYNPGKKYSRQQLQHDYTLLRNILETKHPALYWYTPKDSMNFYFDSLYNNISDSMTELQFGWHVLAPLTQKIHCGHTSFSMSSHWDKYIKDKTIPSFPLYMRVWDDTMVVIGNLNKKDSLIKNGTIITSINGMRNSELVHKLFQYMPLDGYSQNFNYLRLSSAFPYFHRNVFGIYRNYRVGYLDSMGIEKTVLLPMFSPVADSVTSKIAMDSALRKRNKPTKKQRRESSRSMQIDTAINTAIITLNTFTNGEGRHLRRFINQSFKSIKKQEIKNVILDLRNNGGGDVNMSILLTKYLRKTSFKVADTAYAITKSLRPYQKYIKPGFIDNVSLRFISKQKKEGFYHFGYLERHMFSPKKQHHFDGKIYVLTSGLTFSASSLFCNAVKGQSNVTIAGEETGGGWYGNSGLLIPDIILPVTKLKVRLPLFKIVQFDHVQFKGSGVKPDILILPTVASVRQHIDKKMDVVKSLIKGDK